MHERDKVYKKFCREIDVERRQEYYENYKIKRNELTNKKRSKKKEYYEDYFKKNSKKTSAIWKGIKSLKLNLMVAVIY